MKIINDSDEDLVLQVDGGASRVLLRPYARVCLRVDTSHVVRVFTGWLVPSEVARQPPYVATKQPRPARCCEFYWTRKRDHDGRFLHKCIRYQGHNGEHIDVHGRTPTSAEWIEAIEAIEGGVEGR